MSLTGIWTSQTRKQNGHYQSVKRGLSYTPFLWTHTDDIRAFNSGGYTQVYFPINTKRWDVDCDADSYGVDGISVTFEEAHFFPLNKLKIGFIFPNGYSENMNNLQDPETDTGIALIALYMYSVLSKTPDIRYKGKTPQEITGIEDEQYMGIAPSISSDSYTGSFYTQPRRGSYTSNKYYYRLPTFCFIAPQLYNEGGYYKNLYTAYNSNRVFIFNKQLDNALYSLVYHASNNYRYFSIECSDDITIAISNDLSFRIYYLRKSNDYIQSFPTKLFVTNDEKYPISATKWDSSPNPSDILVRYH